MTTFAPDAHPTLTELEDQLRQAWGRYREHLVDLDGVAYAEAERAEWEHLQTELHEIAAAREAARTATPPRAT